METKILVRYLILPLIIMLLGPAICFFGGLAIICVMYSITDIPYIGDMLIPLRDIVCRINYEIGCYTLPISGFIMEYFFIICPLTILIFSILTGYKINKLKTKK